MSCQSWASGAHLQLDDQTAQAKHPAGILPHVPDCLAYVVEVPGKERYPNAQDDSTDGLSCTGAVALIRPPATVNLWNLVYWTAAQCMLVEHWYCQFSQGAAMCKMDMSEL